MITYTVVLKVLLPFYFTEYTFFIPKFSEAIKAVKVKNNRVQCHIIGAHWEKL